ncbi:hypothetical protein E7T09_01550 [Deinococcus sp. KSM4-11]|uniref:hypothetical protein n=1 Tax=Deinococcus sp. KSM4-11 TaxID=2568654 RepID=UPI0010A529FA|nr:hypothetical protein [Deinococcus sp. KSM4-11]THF87936.1 hypothetical protein E7T09_01550 [Deinococcus sp. KSM4-11]
MTRPTPTHPMTAPLPVPTDQAVYVGLSTDHYPWTDITIDLATRQGQGLSGVFDASQEGSWARFIWIRGELRGGFTWGGQEVAWVTATQALPRARVTLTVQDPRVAQLVWSSRARPTQPLSGTWPTPQATLVRDMFTGILVGAGHGSYWEGGQLIAGTVPKAGAQCTTCSPYEDVSAEQLAAFWQALLAAVSRAAPLENAWREVCARLCSTYVCLDPFAQEVVLRGGHLHLDPSLKVQEFRPALLAALRAALARLGVRLGDLPLLELRARPEWAAAGLENL